ncbi:hypothetical protein [Draconibacterium orientale]|uniref:hypothetical protein n=2 Tax=Draconibacterium orientale TaxID=1168034 RepID=UPI002ABD2233|nr:hypothetical protein [Draconibacterium orientale]
MKNKILYCVIFVFMIMNISNAQLTFDHFEYVETPLQTQIEGIVWDALTASQYNAALSSLSGYSNITIVENPTSEYNCHGWAWHLSEGNTTKVWINFENDDEERNLEHYWYDGSFIEVSSNNEAENVHYYEGDHSADKYSSTLYKSKWGYSGLIIHTPDNVPSIYLGNKKYYASFKVNGPQLVCYGSTATFTTPDYVNCTFNWTYNTNLLNYVSGQGTKTFVVEPKTSTSCGEAWGKIGVND